MKICHHLDSLNKLLNKEKGLELEVSHGRGGIGVGFH